MSKAIQISIFHKSLPDLTGAILLLNSLGFVLFQPDSGSQVCPLQGLCVRWGQDPQLGQQAGSWESHACVFLISGS